MTPVGPDKHPSTAVGAAHRFNKITSSFAAEPYTGSRVRITVSVPMANLLSDRVDRTYEDGWNDALDAVLKDRRNAIDAVHALRHNPPADDDEVGQ